jgi:methyl-accepting chemotaxis protein
LLKGLFFSPSVRLKIAKSSGKITSQKISMLKKFSTIQKTGSVVLILSIIVTGVFLFSQNSNPSKQNIKKQTFEFISKVRKEKKQEVVNYFKIIKEQAQSIRSDQEMLNFFTLIAEEKSSPELEYNLDKHYVTAYSNFYDILFVDATGHIFHSIKKEADYQKNIFTSDKFSSLKLAKSLKKSKNTEFVEYEFYSPSDEAAAFFTVALTDKGKHVGWFILQCETNNINAILANRKDLGRTGEVYLVNKEKMMLSESRFMKDSTILQQKVDTLAVQEALTSKIGEKITNDYRGVRVFSSFEKFELFGATWLIIVEIDEDEVLTEYFKKIKPI